MGLAYHKFLRTIVSAILFLSIFCPSDCSWICLCWNTNSMELSYFLQMTFWLLTANIGNYFHSQQEKLLSLCINESLSKIFFFLKKLKFKFWRFKKSTEYDIMLTKSFKQVICDVEWYKKVTLSYFLFTFVGNQNNGQSKRFLFMNWFIHRNLEIVRFYTKSLELDIFYGF